MSMTYLARDIAGRFHQSASYLDKGYNGLVADLREIASTKMDSLQAAFAAWQTEILANYGFRSEQPTGKSFAYADGVAIIPIHGLLLNRMSWSCSYATGYNFVRSQRRDAVADDDVKLIVYDVNSPGGLASGCAELAREIFDGRSEKPSLSVVDARCYSAAYFLASAADRIVVTPSGGVGSIGCVAMHVDYSDMLSADGVKITFIIAGDEKVDGNPYERLSRRARASIQRDVDYHRGLFVEAVARHRDTSEDEILATEARCYLPPEALDLGLIDAVETPAEAVANFFNEITSDSDGGEGTMTTKDQSGTQPAASPQPVASSPNFTLDDVRRVAAEAATAAVTAGLAADRQARNREKAITSSEEAKGRETLAAHLATETDMSVEAAVAVLKASPKQEEKPQPGSRRQDNGFTAAMTATGNPTVGADGQGDGNDESTTPQAKAAAILKDYGAASGKVVDLKPTKAA